MPLPATPPQLTMPLPMVLIFECKNPPRAKFRFLAAFEQKANGELTVRVDDAANRFGIMTDILNQWIGETEEEAREKAILWWYAAFDLNKEIVRKGSASLGLVWLNKKSTAHRVRVKEEEVQPYLDDGYKRGKEFLD